jgi:hypothetical protein
MEPTYATYDPLSMTWTNENLATDLRGSDIAEGIPIPPGGGEIVYHPASPGPGYHPDPRGFGQLENQIFNPETGAYTATGGSTFLNSIGNALGNVINAFGQQLPGIITGQPTSGMYYPPGYVPPQSSGLSPLLLIGGAVLVGYLIFKKK